MNRPLLLTAALLASLTSGIAQACPPGKHEQCDPKKHGRMEPMAAPGKASLDELKLSAEQDAAWKAMQERNRARMDKHFQEIQDEIEQAQPLSAPQRMERRHALMERHQKDRAESIAEFRAFYDKLSPEQQKMLDANSGKADRPGPMHQGCEPKRLPQIKK
jgi:hypothetical protein